MKPIDLRSDTVTHPTDAMREAMATAEVDDDVFDEDPTVHRLERLASEKLGKEAALLVPSGTMGNLVSLLTHCQRGDGVLLGDRSHIFQHEVGGLSALGGLFPHILGNADDGTLPLASLEAAIQPPDIHCPPTRLICLENTHNFCHGAPLPVQYMAAVGALARRRDLKLHLDGARLFNAAAALAVTPASLAEEADSVMVCLSKGLSAPVGSVVCGSRAFIRRARKWRKMLGGGMRQAGHIAAAGIVALEQQVERLREDHENTLHLALGLQEAPGIELDLARVKTNILFFQLSHPSLSAEAFLSSLEKDNVKILLTGPVTFRAVVHREISRKDIDTVVQTARKLLTA
ncbi:MAG: low-specificity L-threonine aldolase [Nitrospinaceae bacterium]|nr:MAG: low-specificity L-threonine aldolase [Nitrospinaceae bacterium]